MIITLRAARVNKGYTLRDVANLVNKSIDTISRYEKDSTDIPRDLMFNLLRIYNVDIDNIFFGVESDFIEHNKKLNRESDYQEEGERI